MIENTARVDRAGRDLKLIRTENIKKVPGIRWYLQGQDVTKKEKETQIIRLDDNKVQLYNQENSPSVLPI